jgi:hypothetical protein
MLLQSAFRQWEEASITSYTFEPPDWLRDWCLKWGYVGSVTVLAVSGYPAAGSATHRSAALHTFGMQPKALEMAPTATLFVPTMCT